MPYTVNSAFQLFKSRIEITDLQQSAISTRQQNVRSALNAELWIDHDFLSGSYARDTMIRPPSDIDLFIVLNQAQHLNDYYYGTSGPYRLMGRIKRILDARYQTTTIRRDGQAVSLIFSDFGFDVVPAFARNGGGYLIPSGSTNTWIQTDPTTHIRLMRERNQATNGLFKPLVKMLKHWNRVKCDSFFKSFHLEVMAYEIFGTKSLLDYPTGIAQFFWSAEINIQHSTFDPAGLSGQLDTYLNSGTKRDQARRLLLAAETATKAAVEAGKVSESGGIRGWQTFFGGSFPAYG